MAFSKIRTKLQVGKNNYYLSVYSYENNKLAILLETKFNYVDDITVNLDGFGFAVGIDEIFLNENFGRNCTDIIKELYKQGVFIKELKEINYGNFDSKTKMVKINIDKLKEYDPIGYAYYAKERFVYSPLIDISCEYREALSKNKISELSYGDLWFYNYKSNSPSEFLVIKKIEKSLYTLFAEVKDGELIFKQDDSEHYHYCVASNTTYKNYDMKSFAAEINKELKKSSEEKSIKMLRTEFTPYELDVESFTISKDEPEMEI